MTQHSSTTRRVVAVVLLLVSVAALAVAGCGSSPTSTASPTAQSASSPSLHGTWSTVGQLQVPLVGMVVANAAGFSDAERTYLVRSNVAWNTVVNATSAYTDPSTTMDASGTEHMLAQAVTTTTTLWLKMKAPSPRFAGLHKQAQRLVKQLSVMSQLTAEYARAGTPAEKDDLATKLASKGASIATLADRVAAGGDALRDQYGAAPVADPVVAPASTTGDAQVTTTDSAATTGTTADLTSAEKTQIQAIVDDSMWITGPLQEAQAMMSEPVTSWSVADRNSFCLNMGFIQSTCDDWTNKQAAGPTMAYAFDQYVTGLRILRKAAGQLITMAEDLSLSAGRAGAANLNKATPYISNGLQGFKALLPSAFN
jgi:hypothetical protein